jgi:phosphoesterase RecJ-like protein
MFPAPAERAAAIGQRIMHHMDDVYQNMINLLSQQRRVLLTTHARPDGDALGTCAALSMGLRAKNIATEVLLLSPLPQKYRFVFEENGIVHHIFERAWPSALVLESFDALLVADTGTWSQLPGLQEKLRASGWRKPMLVLDHHLTQENWADAKLVVTEAAAAGEIAAELLELWDVTMTPAIATALFVAIASDTGWFQFSNTRPFTLRLAATLMEAGVDTDRLYQNLYHNERAERVAIQTRAMQSLELLAGGKLAVMTIRKKDFTDTHAGVPDTENIINVPLMIRTVEVSILITEPIDSGPVRVSLRSKGKLDVARFAEQFGGGGHARASGLKLQTSLEDAHKQVVSAAVKAVSLEEPRR